MKTSFGYGERLDIYRVERFMDGTFPAEQYGMLAQEIIESGQALKLGPAVYRMVVHCVDVDLATVAGRYVQ